MSFSALAANTKSLGQTSGRYRAQSRHSRASSWGHL